VAKAPGVLFPRSPSRPRTQPSTYFSRPQHRMSRLSLVLSAAAAVLAAGSVDTPQPAPNPDQKSPVVSTTKPAETKVLNAEQKSAVVSTTKPAETKVEAKAAPVEQHAPQQLSDARGGAGAAQGLWSGTDLSAERVRAIDHRLGHGFLRKVVDTPAKLNVQIFGLQNSGADLMNALVHMNFGNQLNYYSGGSADSSTNSRHGHWTHANLKEKWKIEKGSILAQKNDNIHAIIIIRNPLSWLQAMRANPEELESCVAGDDWIVRPCTHKIPSGQDSKVPSQTFSSLAAIWNQWYDGFQNAELFGFPHRVIITYENLVRNPKGAMTHVGNFLGLKEPAQGWAMPSDSKDRDEAIHLMMTKRYLELYSPTQKSQACLQLDKDLQHLYGFDDCDWTKYKAGQGARGGGLVHSGRPGMSP